MEAVAASAEVTVLIWSAVLLLVQVVAQAAAASDLGPTYLLGNRDTPRESNSLVSRRLLRALRNMLETYPVFIALTVALIVTGKTGGIAATGAWLWLIARVAYVIVYAVGIPVLRTLIWAASLIGLIMMIVRLLG